MAGHPSTIRATRATLGAGGSDIPTVADATATYEFGHRHGRIDDESGARPDEWFEREPGA
ncbi:MAG: hypothetical protein HND55_09710 [Pseudomonadota bacterium]|nr:MAG: hypothetical protein HND55_09710 [Pseudomonadota bacterium]